MIEWKEEDGILVGYLGKWEVCTYDKDFMDGCLTFNLPPSIFRGQLGQDKSKDIAETMLSEWVGSAGLCVKPVKCDKCGDNGYILIDNGVEIIRYDDCPCTKDSNSMYNFTKG